MGAAPLIAEGPPWVHDGQNLRRIMGTVLVALIPVFIMGCFNTGYIANLAIGSHGGLALEGWRESLLAWLGVPHDHHNWSANLLRGAAWIIPPLLVSYAVGGFWELLICRIRGLGLNEGFLVTATIYGLSLPVSMPMWKAALGISFGIIFAKYAFGGVGYNVFNVMAVSRGFLFFSFPHHFSGPQPYAAVDSYTRATPLTALGSDGVEALVSEYSWLDAFIGLTPGSLAETSTLACLIGAVILLTTRVASWRIMAGIALGVFATSLLFNLAASDSNPALSLPFWWHFVIGSLAFGGVFMATDPVTAPATPAGRWIYGLMIGCGILVIRCLNPAYTEGTLLTILLMNAFSSLIDHGVVARQIRRRRLRVERA